MSEGPDWFGSAPRGSGDWGCDIEKTCRCKVSLNQITQLVVLQDIDTRCGQENQLRPMAWGHVSFSIDNKMGSGATKLAIRAQVFAASLGEAQDVVLKKTKPELAIVLKGQDKKGDPSGNLGETDVVSDFEILKMELVMLDTARDMVDWVKKAEEKHYQQLEGIAAIPSNELPVVEYVRGCLAFAAKDHSERLSFPFGARSVWMIENMIQGKFTKFICNRKAVTLSEAAETYPKASRYLEYLQHMTFVAVGLQSLHLRLAGMRRWQQDHLDGSSNHDLPRPKGRCLTPLVRIRQLEERCARVWFEHVCNEFLSVFQSPTIGNPVVQDSHLVAWSK
ncbi:hypothetical protein BKA70DRAFT_1433580 [Coprinopsis sp. MPI-PUGE-AT-0042]|nr:hypothetical protein BKA70DRAFT_1433580 [Coprinopsis sp. MPI-PUGE-AT-0042]